MTTNLNGIMGYFCVDPVWLRHLGYPSSPNTFKVLKIRDVSGSRQVASMVITIEGPDGKPWDLPSWRGHFPTSQ